MESTNLGVVIMLSTMSVLFFSRSEKSESLFFAFCLFLIFLNVDRYLGKDGILYFLTAEVILLGVIRIIRFILVKKYNKKLF